MRGLPASTRLPAALLALTALLAPAVLGEAAAQEQFSSITVFVRASDTMQPLPGARVNVQGVGIVGVTDARGFAQVRRLPVGARQIEVRFLGYALARSVVVLQPDRDAMLSFDLDVQPIQLAAVKVRARRSILHSNGFFGRRGSGFGTFLTREEIADMRPRFMSDVLRRVAGISLVSSAYGGSSRASMRGSKVLGNCPIQYYVDGTMTSLYNVDEIRPDDVEGLEIYRGAATIPPAYNKGTAMCGVILIWTRIQ